MTRDEAIAAIRRLCPPGTLEALSPTGGHRIGTLAPRRAVVEEQAATGSDPRAELDDVPTRRERRPESVTGFAAVKPALQEGREAAGLEKP